MSTAVIRRLVVLIIAIIAGVISIYFVPEPLPEISRADFMDEVRAGRVHKIEIYDQEWILGESPMWGEFRTVFDRQKDAGLADQLRAMGIEIWYSKSSSLGF